MTHPMMDLNTMKTKILKYFKSICDFQPLRLYQIWVLRYSILSCHPISKLTHHHLSFSGPCVEFLKGLGRDLSLNISIEYPLKEQYPLVLMTWEGSQPELPSILLNSHIDVVPVAEKLWKYPPFGAHIDDKGNIYARGTQDMKGIGMLYLAAIRALKRKGIKQLKRTVHLTYCPDEEVAGIYGMQTFAWSDKFKSLNIGGALDEGYPSESSTDLEVFYLDKVGMKCIY